MFVQIRCSMEVSGHTRAFITECFCAEPLSRKPGFVMFSHFASHPGLRWTTSLLYRIVADSFIFSVSKKFAQYFWKLLREWGVISGEVAGDTCHVLHNDHTSQAAPKYSARSVLTRLRTNRRRISDEMKVPGSRTKRVRFCLWSWNLGVFQTRMNSYVSQRLANWGRLSPVSLKSSNARSCLLLLHWISQKRSEKNIPSWKPSFVVQKCTQRKSPRKNSSWSSRWFEEISVALTWLTLIWLTLIWLTSFVKILTFFTQYSQLGNSFSMLPNGTNLTK